jgi:hypothetical protein
MAEARPNIAIAPIRIDARIIVFLCLGVCRSPSRRFTGDNRPNELSPSAYAREPHDPVLGPARDEGSALERLD